MDLSQRTITQIAPHVYMDEHSHDNNLHVIVETQSTEESNHSCSESTQTSGQHAKTVNASQLYLN